MKIKNNKNNFHNIIKIVSVIVFIGCFLCSIAIYITAHKEIKKFSHKIDSLKKTSILIKSENNILREMLNDSIVVKILVSFKYPQDKTVLQTLGKDMTENPLDYIKIDQPNTNIILKFAAVQEDIGLSFFYMNSDFYEYKAASHSYPRLVRGKLLSLLQVTEHNFNPDISIHQLDSNNFIVHEINNMLYPTFKDSSYLFNMPFGITSFPNGKKSILEVLSKSVLLRK